MLRVYCPTDQEPARIVFGTLWQDDDLMPAHDVVKVSWDKGEPVIMSYKPTGRRSIVPMRPGMKDNLEARWPALQDARTFFERLQSAQTVEVTFPTATRTVIELAGWV